MSKDLKSILKKLKKHQVRLDDTGEVVYDQVEDASLKNLIKKKYKEIKFCL